MAPQYSNPFYSSDRYGSRPRDSVNSKLALDNLIRRELKVSDPNNAQEVANALLTRYKDTPQAIAIDREAEGLPFLLTPSMPSPVMQAETSSDAELQQAMDDVERDLNELTSNAILKDVTPELQGWAMAIRSMMTEAFNSARFALDSSQRDKTFGIRRTLGDYARMVRLVGALSSPVVNVNYRNLAQSIDEVTSVLLVTMGEALANVSFNRSRYLLQVPYSELQARRDSVIYALRNFIGSTQEAYAPNEWPRGVDAYRQLYKYLDDQGQGDLRSLLTENELSRIMDMLIQRASHGNIEGLRHLGATAQLDIPRLRRLVIIAGDLQTVNPQSPPLTAFLEALQLFIDAFEGAGGFRLLRLARPPILFYGLYGSSNNERSAEMRLVDLAIERNRLAELLDCFARCGCTPETVKCQIILDKILYDIDRAIDLYALGTAENDEPEFRAVAYSYVVDTVLQGMAINGDPCLPPAPQPPNQLDLNTRIRNALGQVRNLLFSRIDSMPPEPEDKLPELRDPQSNEPDFKKLVDQELCIQQDTESRWRDLVQTMAPACIPFTSTNGNLGVFNVIEAVIQNARQSATGNGEPCELSFPLPAQYEISLSAQANAQAIVNQNLAQLTQTLGDGLGVEPEEQESEEQPDS
ncbi:MAG: hypothetical protein QNJ46_05335 [Leptolyngbyaceae cyanobacterium MO_188.B28]|nr:hypothetical protein [Leptolyngbyaceae cyanobacterium MO_188.B28]